MASTISGDGNTGILMTRCAQPNFVSCPRAIPTCLVVSGVLDSIGNIKDRIARRIVLEAEKRGERHLSLDT